MKSNDIVHPKNVDEETATPNNKEYKSANRVDFYRQRSRRRNRNWKSINRVVLGTIRKGIGKPWDDVYSELKSKVNLDYNGYRQVWWGINKDVEIIDGVPYCCNRSYELSPGNFYIDNEGLVQVVPNKPKTPFKKNDKYCTVIDGKEYWRILDIWYEVEPCTRKTYWRYHDTSRDYCYFTTHGFTKPELDIMVTEPKEYIRKKIPDGNYINIYQHTHKKKHQLSTKEIRDLNLHLFTIDE